VATTLNSRALSLVSDGEVDIPVDLPSATSALLQAERLVHSRQRTLVAQVSSGNAGVHHWAHAPLVLYRVSAWMRIRCFKVCVKRMPKLLID
jgi:hypothetical protein